MRAALESALAFSLVACALFASTPGRAQTTDGYHSILVIPVVVDTASFTQRFTVSNPSSTAMNFNVTYFPAVGTSQASPLDCGAYALTAGQSRNFSSLRSLCATLAPGSQFGFLYLQEPESRSSPFTAYSRVSNPQGNGFSVEAFPASAFEVNTSLVIGVRRLAASGGNPAFQTNCFVGRINNVNVDASTSLDTPVTVYDSTGNALGSALVPVQPGRITRLLDVFAFVGAAPGDYDNATVRFSHDPLDAAGLVNFCTVQDNTSFGADFRIAKSIPIKNGGDSLYNRDARQSVGIAVSSQDFSAAVFRLLPDGARHNTHVMYFRHPDYVQCELINPATGVRALPEYGLEMRMLEADGVTTLAGGNNQTGFGKIYLGDKKQRNGGANSRYTIDVETTDPTDRALQTPYELRCQSGSGHTFGDMIINNSAEDLF
jgi:hypothetical protein